MQKYENYNTYEKTYENYKQKGQHMKTITFVTYEPTYEKKTNI